MVDAPPLNRFSSFVSSLSFIAAAVLLQGSLLKPFSIHRLGYISLCLFPVIRIMACGIYHLSKTHRIPVSEKGSFSQPTSFPGFFSFPLTSSHPDNSFQSQMIHHPLLLQFGHHHHQGVSFLLQFNNTSIPNLPNWTTSIFTLTGPSTSVLPFDNKTVSYPSYSTKIPLSAGS